jgi:glycosyltransferase involved in cell wall biosynthesis
MKRVLHCFGTLNRGGIQSFVMNIYRKIDRTKVQFDFLLVNSNAKGDFYEEVVSLGGRAYYICPRNKSITKNKKELEDFFAAHKEYDTLHYHMSSCSYSLPIDMANKYGYKKIIMHAHSSKQTGRFYHTFFHKLHQPDCLRKATHYLACSDKAAQWLYGTSAQKAVRANNGIETADYVFNQNTREMVRKEWGVNQNEIIVGHVGRFVQPKNHLFLVQIFSEYLKLNPHSKLVLVGDGELFDKCKNKIEELKIEQSVVLLGKRSDVPDVLQGFDLFLMPSYFEGFPVTMMEAQAADLPCVVSSNITREAKVLDAVEYLDLDLGASEWAKHIEGMLEIEHVRKDTSREIIAAGYDSQTVANDLEKLYLE